MAVRIRLCVRNRETGASIETTALINTGFETDSPQLLLPTGAARELGLWRFRSEGLDRLRRSEPPQLW